MVVDLDQIMDDVQRRGVRPARPARASSPTPARAGARPPRYVVLAGEGTLDYRNLLGYRRQPGAAADGAERRRALPLGQPAGRRATATASPRSPSAASPCSRPPSSTPTRPSSPPTRARRGRRLDRHRRAPRRRHRPRRRLRGGQRPGRRPARRGLHAGADRSRRRRRSPTPATQLLAALGEGAAFVNYMGHGALDRLSSGGLLTSADVPGLTNGARLPVVTAMTCTINRFAVPGDPRPRRAAGEERGRRRRRGLGSLGALDQRRGGAAGRALLPLRRDARLGDRVLRAIAEFRALGGNVDLPRIYGLLGDPALRLQAPPPAAVRPSGTSE